MAQTTLIGTHFGVPIITLLAHTMFANNFLQDHVLCQICTSVHCMDYHKCISKVYSALRLASVWRAQLQRRDVFYHQFITYINELELHKHIPTIVQQSNSV